MARRGESADPLFAESLREAEKFTSDSQKTQQTLSAAGLKGAIHRLAVVDERVVQPAVLQRSQTLSRILSDVLRSVRRRTAVRQLRGLEEAPQVFPRRDAGVWQAAHEFVGDELRPAGFASGRRRREMHGDERRVRRPFGQVFTQRQGSRRSGAVEFQLASSHRRIFFFFFLFFLLRVVLFIAVIVVLHKHCDEIVSYKDGIGIVGIIFDIVVIVVIDEKWLRDSEDGGSGIGSRQQKDAAHDRAGNARQQRLGDFSRKSKLKKLINMERRFDAIVANGPLLSISAHKRVNETIE